MSRTGIIGGTFDPPHNAHIVIAETALRLVPLDKVLFMPAPDPPLKQTENVAPYKMRLEMVRLAIAGRQGLELSLLEEFRAGSSYTVDLLRHYHTLFREEPFLIVGADSLEELPRWKEPEEVLSLATLVVFPRTGCTTCVPVEGDASIVLFESPVIDVSSTEIRSRIRAGASVDALLPKVVHEFVLDNHLYT